MNQSIWVSLSGAHPWLTWLVVSTFWDHEDLDDMLQDQSELQRHTFRSDGASQHGCCRKTSPRSPTIFYSTMVLCFWSFFLETGLHDIGIFTTLNLKSNPCNQMGLSE